MLLKSTKQTLNEVKEILEQLNFLPTDKINDYYVSQHLGKHVRHILDHFYSVQSGFKNLIIDYNQRSRGDKIEVELNEGQSQLDNMFKWVEKLQQEKVELLTPVKIVSEISCQQSSSLTFESNIAREFLYLINHTIHHAAHMALICKNNGIKIPLNTGLAPCTMTFLRELN